MRLREVASDPNWTWLIRKKAKCPGNKSVVKTKHWQCNKKTFAPDMIKGIEKNQEKSLYSHHRIQQQKNQA